MLRNLFNLLFHLATLRFVPAKLYIVCFVALGVFAGVGLTLMRVSRATSYMEDDPAACVNCHIMRPQYDTWRHSSHADAATCNDCHVPHNTLAGAYAFKARDGIYHSTIFTLRKEPQAIHISALAEDVVEGNCVRCHEQAVGDVHQSDGEVRCWDCHREVPHGEVRSLSSTPGVMSPELPPVFESQVPRIGGRSPDAPSESEETQTHD